MRPDLVPDLWRPRAGIDTVPFAGVAFVLLLVLMTMTPAVTNCFGPVLPRASTAVPVEEDAVTIAIDHGGWYWLDGAADPGPIPAERLGERLRGALAERPRDRRVVYLHADRQVSYAAVLPVLEAVRGAGVRRLGLRADLR